MSCPHLRNQGLWACEAVAGGVVPSLFERERHCFADGGWRCCPSHVAREQVGAPIDVERYYAIWTGHPPVKRPAPMRPEAAKLA